MKILPQRDICTNLSFSEFDSALNGLGIKESKMGQSIYAILAAILHLGNVNFTTNDEGFAKINENDNSHQFIEHAADLLKIDMNDLEQVLLQRTITVSSNQKDSVS